VASDAGRIVPRLPPPATVTAAPTTDRRFSLRRLSPLLLLLCVGKVIVRN